MRVFQSPFSKDAFEPHFFKHRTAFFEGWYYKMVYPDGKRFLICIFGFTVGQSRERFPFVQIYDSVSKQSTHFDFPANSFQFNKKTKTGTIHGNSFSKNKLVLELANDEFSLSLNVDFQNSKTKKSHVNSMGPARWFLGLECYHAVISMQPHWSGQIELKGEQIKITNGKAYIEKNWGRHFPSSYVWIHCNQFSDLNTSLVGLSGKLPWFFGKHGFFFQVYAASKKYRFWNGNLSTIRMTSASEKSILIELKNWKYMLSIQLSAPITTFQLRAPKSGKMLDYVAEHHVEIQEIRLTSRRNPKKKILLDSSKLALFEWKETE
jgi:hypothetical protein